MFIIPSTSANVSLDMLYLFLAGKGSSGGYGFGVVKVVVVDMVLE